MPNEFKWLRPCIVFDGHLHTGYYYSTFRGGRWRFAIHGRPIPLPSWLVKGYVHVLAFIEHQSGGYHAKR